MERYDGRIIIGTKINTKGIKDGVKEVKGAFGGLKTVLQSVGTALAAVFAVRQIVQFGKESVNAARELSDALTGLQSVVEGQGRSFSQAQQFINEYTQDGLVPATNAITAYKNLALRGYDDSQIQQVMTALKDSAAFGRQSSYSMGEAVQSATEGLKNENSILVDNAGVTKNVAKMWDEYAKSIGTTSNRLTQQQKIQAEVNGILEESKYQAGDAAKVAGTLSGQMMQLSFNFNNLKIAVGNAINPILTAFLPIVNTAIAAVTRLANAVATVMGLIFGKASVGAANTAKQNNAVASSAADAAAAEESLADSVKEAGEAAKDNLSGLDELNKYQEATSSSGGSGSSGSAGGGIAESADLGTIAVEADVEDEVSPKLQKIVDNINRLLDPLKKIDFTPLKESIGRLGEAFSRLGQSILNGLLWAYENVLVPFAKWTIEDALPASIDVFSAALDVLTSVVEALKPLGKWLWEKFLQPIAEWTGGKVIDILKDLHDKLEDVSDWIDNNKGIVQDFAVALGSFAAAWGLVNIAAGVWNVIGVIATTVTTAFGAAVTFLTSPIGLVVVAIGALIAIIIHLAKNWDGVKATASAVWEGIKSVWNSASSWFSSKVIEPMKNAWASLKTYILNVWSGIWSGVKGAINWIIGGINGMISGITSGINAVIKALNRLKVTIPSWVPSYGGKTFGVNLSTVSSPRIPLLAQGAVIPPNKEFMAVLGDQKNGTNLETPESLLRQIFREEMSNNTGNGSITVNATANGRVLFQLLIDEAKAQQMRTGRNPFLLTT